MKFLVQDINELNDSREILESKPHPFTRIFIYIVLAFIVVALTWSWFSEKEIIVKASGVVRPANDIYKVSNMVSAKVKSIDFENGKEVNEGDVLYTLESTDINKDKESLNDKINTLNEEIENLDKLKDSVNQDKNLFDKNSEKEKDFYYKYENYNNGNKASTVDNDSIGDMKTEIDTKINGLNKLKQSINDGKNYLSKESIYFEEYNNYKISESQITDKIEQAEKTYNDLKDKEEYSEQCVQAKELINQSQGELKKLKSDYKIKIDSSLEELKSKLKEVNNNSNKLKESTDLNKEKNKSGMLSQIEDTLKQDNEKLKELEENLDKLDTNIDYFTVKAPKDGIADINLDFKIGDIIQAGATPITILPDESNFKIDVAVADKDIANINEGQNVKFSFPSLPYKEYGFLNGEIDKISADSKIDKERGISYYTAEASIDKNKVYSHKGEEAEIKNGMTCEVQVIARKEKMLYYLLEKLNLKA